MHLSMDDYLRASTGDAPASVRSHLDSCGDCRGLVELLVRTERDAKAASVPEPSPLFWAHLSERIRVAIDTSPRASRWEWLASLDARFPRRRPAWLMGASLVVGALVMAIWTMTEPRPAVETASRPPASTDGQRAAVTTPVVEQVTLGVEQEDLEWDLMMDVTSKTDIDHMTLGLGVGTADQAFEALSDEDRMNLAEWLALELEPARGGRS